MNDKAAFLDRDDTIIRNIPYLTDPKKVELMPGAVEGLKMLRDANYRLVLVSNQSLVSRGYGSVRDVEAVMERMQQLLGDQGVTLDAVYYCPHRDDDNCTCRKPQPGLLLRAARDLDLSLGASVMFGDKTLDTDAGDAAGCAVSYRVGTDRFPTLLDAANDWLSSK